MGGSLGSPDSLNRYLYAKDDPVNLVDPSGKDCVLDFVLTLATDFFAAFDGLAALAGLLESTIAASALFGFVVVARIFFPIAALMGAYLTEQLILTCFS